MKVVESLRLQNTEHMASGQHSWSLVGTVKLLRMPALPGPTTIIYIPADRLQDASGAHLSWDRMEHPCTGRQVLIALSLLLLCSM